MSFLLVHNHAEVVEIALHFVGELDHFIISLITQPIFDLTRGPRPLAAQVAGSVPLPKDWLEPHQGRE